MKLAGLPRSALSLSPRIGEERLLLLGVRLLPRGTDRALARDLETEHLWLRSIGPVRMFLLMTPWHRDPVLMAGLRHRRGPMPLLAWLRTLKGPNNIYRFVHALVPKGRRRAIGIIAVNLDRDGRGGAASHLAISDAAQRGGPLAVEARAAILEHFFANGISGFYASVNSRNHASVFVYKRLGFRVAGTRPVADDTVPGGVAHLIDFVLTRQDWIERRPVADSRDTQPA